MEQAKDIISFIADIEELEELEELEATDILEDYDFINNAYNLEIETERQALDSFIMQDIEASKNYYSNLLDNRLIKKYLSFKEIASLLKIAKNRVIDFYKAGCFIDIVRSDIKNTILISSAELYKFGDSDFIKQVQAYKRNENEKSKIKNSNKPYNTINGYYKKKKGGILQDKDILQKQERVHLIQYQYKKEASQ